MALPTLKAGGAKAVWSAFKHIFSAMPFSMGIKVLTKLNQKGGIDCPSCAWPDPDHKRTPFAEYCENGAKAIAEEATTRKIGVPFFQRYSVEELKSKSDFWLGKQGRLDHPMFKPKGKLHYEAISWEQAYGKIARHLNRLSSPNEAIFYTSGRSSNEAAWLYQLFVRAYGTNNLPDCSNMCHESSGVALQKTLGIGKGTVKLEDFEQTDLILIIGQNPGTNHPRMLTSLEKAKQNGAKIVSINPLKEAGLVAFENPQKVSGLLGKGTIISDHYLQLKINSDLALLKYFCLQLIKRQEAGEAVLDQEFILHNTAGFEAYREQTLRCTEEELLSVTGLEKPEVDAVVDLLAQKKKIIICWAMGLTQHVNAVDTLQELVNLLLLKGSVGKPGTGTCPVRGHSNVQGDRTVGITHKPSAAFNEALRLKFGFNPPEKTGFDVVESIEAMHSGNAKVFMALGGNFFSAAPDSSFTAEALSMCQLTVQISTKLNRSHLICGEEALILPCLGRTDKDRNSKTVSTENSMGVVQSSEGSLEPVSANLLSEPEIICHIAAATLGNRFNIPWQEYKEDYDLIRKGIEETIPGFTDYATKIKKPGGFYLPNEPRNGRFNTDKGKAVFTINKLTINGESEFTLMTIRSHDQFNTTIYGLNDRYRGVYAERDVVFMNAEDIKSLGLSEGQRIHLQNKTGGIHREVKNLKVYPYSIPRGNLAMYFPEANTLVPIALRAHGSQTPASKSVPVEVSF